MTTSSESAAGLLPATRRALTHRVAVGQAEGRTPSLAAAVTRDGGRAWFGARSMLDGHEPDGDTQYRIGSLTKTFIAVLVMRLRDEGRIDLADPLGKHLDAGEAAGATIAQLLSHTAGLASETPGPWWERSPGELRPGLADILSPAPHPAGRLFHYSNPGYGLLGTLVGQLRGYGWEEALRQEILDPLGMARTTLAPEEPHARGFAVHPWADVMQLEPADPAGLMAPAGELWSTADDLCRFAVFLLDGDDRVLPAATLAEMCAPASPPGDDAWAGGYGLGLQLFRQDGRMLYGHSGSMPGFLATLCVSPADGVGGITLANATSGPDIAGIAIDLVRIVADNEPRLPDRWQPLAEVDQALLALTGPWYWGPRAYVLRLVADRGLELGPATGRGRASRFRAEPDGTWTGLDGYYTGETLRLVRGPDGTVDHLDLGSFVFTREPYGPDAPLAARPDPEGWRAFLGCFVPCGPGEDESGVLRHTGRMPERSSRPRKPDPGKGHARGDREADAAEPGGRRLLGRQETGPGPVRFREDQIALLRGAGKPKTWPRDSVFLSESDQGGSAFLIEQGQVKVTVSSRSGYTTLLAIRGPGELIGELSALDGQTRSGTATTLSEVRAIEIRADRFRALLERNGHLALAVLNSVVRRLRDSDRRRAEFGSQRTKLRVASVLVEMAEHYGTARPGAGAAKVIAVTQQELASASGTSRESVVRSLRDLHDAGLVEKGRGKVIVLDPASLAELVRS